MKHEYSPLLQHISSQITFSDSERELFLSVLRMTRLKRRQFLIQPGMVSKDRSFIVQGAFRVFLMGNDGDEHTISLAIDNGWTGDPASFISQEPSHCLCKRWKTAHLFNGAMKTINSCWTKSLNSQN